MLAWSSALEEFALFRTLSAEQRLKVLNALVRQDLVRGQLLVAQGGPSDSFFLVLHGALAVRKTGYSEPIAELRAGEGRGRGDHAEHEQVHADERHLGGPSDRGEPGHLVELVRREVEGGRDPPHGQLGRDARDERGRDASSRAATGTCHDRNR